MKLFVFVAIIALASSHYDEQDLGLMVYIKAADEVYNVGRATAPYVKEGYEDIRNPYSSSHDE